MTACTIVDVRSIRPEEVGESTGVAGASAGAGVAGAGVAGAGVADMGGRLSPVVILSRVVVILMSLTKNAGFGFLAADLVNDVSVELSRLLYGAGLVVAGLVCDRNLRYGALCCAGPS